MKAKGWSVICDGVEFATKEEAIDWIKGRTAEFPHRCFTLAENITRYSRSNEPLVT